MLLFFKSLLGIRKPQMLTPRAELFMGTCRNFMEKTHCAIGRHASLALVGHLWFKNNTITDFGGFLRLLLLSLFVFGALGAWDALLGTQAAVAAIPPSIESSCEGELKLTRFESKEYPLCVIGGSALSQEFLERRLASELERHGGEDLPLALQAYIHRKKAESRTGGVCGTYAAELIVTKDSQNEVYNICHFSDGSYIDETTLWLGPGSNEELDDKLHL